MQRLLSEADSDDEAVREDLRGYVVEHLGDPGAVLVVDETGDVKKGTATVGVQRQYTGTAGRLGNSQVAVYLTYAGPRGYALVDRALYLPKAWTDDSGRCAAAGVPKDVEFATKPALAKAMIECALVGGTPAAWVTGDEFYGADQKLRKAASSFDRMAVPLVSISDQCAPPSPSHLSRKCVVVRSCFPTDWPRVALKRPNSASMPSKSFPPPPMPWM